ncbi:LacI family transcriptional regulator [Kineothrix alysoides]|uniref:LacI family transcriptional regulator n=1 Tax=Kineothrix alysoides TaxID=1469948 RepID=A0A4R1QYQ1_9FIRM|nr:LacI family DNA-binding transcriptional regulator [Kineothrix alysoides]TCL58094.1 LacI family transcriptional regulator [Kineothrix alysoides]
MPVTINDVAKEAGISTSTVSKVLNHWTTISPETTARVNAAIAKLNYTPNARAVSFARKSTRNIVYLTSLGKDEAYRNPHMFDIMCGVHKELTKHNYTLALVDISDEAYPGESVHNVIEGKCADGLIIHGSAVTKELSKSITQQNYPHIIIGHPGFESSLCWIDTNHGLAGQFAAKHMISCGYKDVAFIGGRKTDYISMQRQKGFIGGMYEYGYHIPDIHIGYTDSSIPESCEAACSMLISHRPPQAIVCENNTIALGVIKAVEKLKLKVPEEVALLVFDTYPYSGILSPKPTVIDINVYDMGVQAGATILRKLKNPSLLVQSYTTLPIVIQGQSTQPLRKQ